MLDMKRNKSKSNCNSNYLISAGRIFCIILLITILTYTAPSSIADDSDIKDNEVIFLNYTDSIKNEKIESLLLHKRDRIIREKTIITSSHSNELENETMIRVIFELVSNDSNYIRNLSENGAIIEKNYKNLVQTQIPISKLELFSDLAGIQFIRTPFMSVPAVESQGVSTINADELHDKGITGNNVKVAVIDTGFKGYDTNTEIPFENIIEAKSFSGDITGGGEVHGTACAEVLLDVSPDASLYLLNFKTELEFQEAVDYAISCDVDIISCSVGWFEGPFDGTGLICDIANKAYDNDILFVNSVGNQASQHWEGTYNEKEVIVGDKTWYVHDFSSGDYKNTISAGTGRIIIVLSWDDWPESDKDFDIYLINEESNTIIWNSENVQTGTQKPLERLDYYVTTPGRYGVLIRNKNSDENVDFELYSFYHRPQYNVESSSISIPADSPKVLGVGATFWENDAIESFSSRGPTNDGRIKPDVVAPDGVSNSVKEYFYGTSASAPHVAGAAALMLSINPLLTPDEIQSTLKNTAVFLGDPYSFGSGRIDVYQAIQEIQDMDITPPDISSPDDQIMEKDAVGDITWTITEANPDQYQVLRNGEMYVPLSKYENGIPINVDIDTSEPGVWNYTIVASDLTGSTATDQVDITVHDLPINININITSHADGGSTTSSSILVTGFVDGNNSKPTVYVNENEAELDLDGFAGTYSVTVPLLIGENQITATATTDTSEYPKSVSITITRNQMDDNNNNGDGSSGGSSGSSGSGGRASGEAFANILISETKREFVNKNTFVSYLFNLEGNIVRYINFTGLSGSGKIAAKIEILKNTSTLVNDVPPDITYRNLNIWIGNVGWDTPQHIANPTISFKVDKSWITENNIDESTITMNRYSDKKWISLTTSLINQDDSYLYFTSKTPAFSSFTITGKEISAGGGGIVRKPAAVPENKPIDESTAVNRLDDGENDEGVITIFIFCLFAGFVVLLIAVQLSRKK